MSVSEGIEYQDGRCYIKKNNCLLYKTVCIQVQPVFAVKLKSSTFSPSSK